MVAPAQFGEPPGSTPSPVPGGQPDLIYDLTLAVHGVPAWSDDVEKLTGRLFAETEKRAAELIDGYIEHLETVLFEPFRSRGEYILELLTLGMVLSHYSELAAHSSAWAIDLARELLWLRHRSRHTRAVIDRARAAILSLFLCRRPPAPAVQTASIDALPHLIAWLQATGEFEQESNRLNNWRNYLDTFSPLVASSHLQTAHDLFLWFKNESAAALAKYTQGVDNFLCTGLPRRWLREDYLFCSRPQVEYHVAMVAAQVMNKGLAASFAGTKHKVVLLPACMRGWSSRTCQATTRGLDVSCGTCDGECSVNRITATLRLHHVPVYLVSHASGFSQSLERWQRRPGIGVVAVACLLNILAGGYEMRARGIPSQCIPLSFPGCEKHWRRKRLPTAVDEARLVQLAIPSDASTHL